MCAAGAAAIVSSSNWFLLCVLQGVVAHACIVIALLESLAVDRSGMAA